jgi:hypothetical protein
MTIPIGIWVQNRGSEHSVLRCGWDIRLGRHLKIRCKARFFYQAAPKCLRSSWEPFRSTDRYLRFSKKELIRL